MKYREFIMARHGSIWQPQPKTMHKQYHAVILLVTSQPVISAKLINPRLMASLDIREWYSL